MPSYNFANGVNAIPSYGQREKVLFGGTWVAGDTWTILATTTEGDLTLGAGNLLGCLYTAMLTFGNRLYIGNGAFLTFSAIGNPAGWEEQDVGAGNVSLQSDYGFHDEVRGLAPFQGRLAVFGRRNIQIWQVDADPNSFARQQVLSNIGTLAPLSVQQLGDLDVFFLDDTGIRSLRARETTLNAFVTDLGSPIDSILQDVLNTVTDPQKLAACGIVEPSSKRYWLHLNGVIYTFSLFPQSKIAAWSTYLPTYETVIASPTATYVAGQIIFTGLIPNQAYGWVRGDTELNSPTVITNGVTSLTDVDGTITPGSGGTLTVTSKADEAYTGLLTTQVPFVPEKFVVQNNVVYVRSTSGDIFAYGGSGGAYDGVQMIAETPWLDDKQPIMSKTAQSVDAGLTGHFFLSAGMDPKTGTLEQVAETGSDTTPNSGPDSTFDILRVPFQSVGTHFKLRAVSSASCKQRCALSSLVFRYNPGNIK